MFPKTWAGLGWADRRRCDVAGDVWVDRGGRVNLWVYRCARRVMAGGGGGGRPPSGVLGRVSALEGR